MLAGVWVLVCLPLLDALNLFGWAGMIPVPRFFEFNSLPNTLDGRLIAFSTYFRAFMFCIGVSLLFAKERGRRRSRLDWTRRWGIFSCYVVLLLFVTQTLDFAAEVLAGVASAFISIALKYQPESTALLIRTTYAYMRYGPAPDYRAFGIQIVAAAIAMLLGCVPLFNAIRSFGSRGFALLLLSPLVVFALVQIVQGARYSAGTVDFFSAEPFFCTVYFMPACFLQCFADPDLFPFREPLFISVIAEAAKWCIVLAIAVWLSIAQIAAWRTKGKSAERQ
jgi:hypothetical protein